MSLESIGKSIGSLVDERLSSPLVSGFVLSWSIINWKFLVILFSDSSVSKTFEMAGALYKTRLDWWGWNVAAPLAASLAYVYLLPLFSRPVHRKWRENLQAAEDDRQEAARLVRLERGESQAIISENHLLRREVIDLRAERDGALAERRTAIEDKTMAELQRGTADAEAAAHKQRHNEIKDALEELQEKLERATNGVIHKQTTLEQVSKLVAELHKEYLPTQIGLEGNVPMHELVLANLKSKKHVPPTFELRMLYVLCAFKDSKGVLSRDGIGKRIEGMTNNVPVHLVISHVKGMGLIQSHQKWGEGGEAFQLTTSGEAVLTALGEFDHVLSLPTKWGTW